MAFLQAFGHYLPRQILGNEELARLLGVEADWIVQSSGIEERRIANPDETVADLGAAAAEDTLAQASPGEIGMLLVSSGSADRRFPGPASEIAHRLGLTGIPAIDLPLASAGSLFGLTLAAQLAPHYGRVLVVAAEKMSAPALSEPLDKNVAILFGDGAGACLVGADGGDFEIVDSALHTDGAYAADLRLDFDGRISMNGYSVIMQATRKIPAVIGEVLSRGGISAEKISAFLMHQANQNLIDRVARTLRVPTERFYTNIKSRGNTSSASMLIAAAEWKQSATLLAGDLICFATFGAGFHWGALLARQT